MQGVDVDFSSNVICAIYFTFNVMNKSLSAISSKHKSRKEKKNSGIKNVPFLQTLITGISLPAKIYQHADQHSFQISQPEVQ